MYRLPSRVYLYTIGDVVAIYRNIISSGEDTIEIEASDVEYIDPFGICMLAAVVNKLNEADISIAIRGVDPNVFEYLRRMDFLKQCRMDKKPSREGTRKNLTDRLVEVHRITDRREIDRSAARLAQAVIGGITDIRLDDTPDEMSGKSEVDQVEHHFDTSSMS